ncbi:MAG: hypothetical protein AAGM22_05400 [Acidobacteriota bacterium]
MPHIEFDGLTADELLALSASDFDELVLRDEPVLFRSGSADVLGRFSLVDSTLIIELAHIDGGGEGVLPAIASLASRVAAQRGLSELEWRVHAVNCARPNPKLRRVLERRGFVIRTIEDVGEVFFQRQEVRSLVR